MYKRLLALEDSARESCFLWGARQTGKSTLLRRLFPEATRYDLLRSDEYRRLLARPQTIREECEAIGLDGARQRWPIIIDEVQKVPDLLDEVHWLMTNRGLRFILCGSSPRKLKRGHGNLLGGRAIRHELFPLTSREVAGFSLERALNHGLLPRHYDAAAPTPMLRSYVGDYLREEIAAEALSRNMPAFNRFLEIAALTNGELVNCQNIAREIGMSSPSVNAYFQVLEDTLMGYFLPAFRKRMKRRLCLAPKFYLFDIGVVALLVRRGRVRPGSELFGKAFEHFLVLELLAHASYSGLHYPLSYWRTTSGHEVDLVIGQAELAIEVKSCDNPHDGHLKGLRAFREEHRCPCVLVSNVARKRRTADDIAIMPWQDFLADLWSGKLLAG